MGIKSYKAIKKPALTPLKANKRLKFAKEKKKQQMNTGIN